MFKKHPIMRRNPKACFLCQMLLSLELSYARCSLLSLERVVSIAYENSPTRFLETVKHLNLMGISLYRKRLPCLVGNSLNGNRAIP